MQEAGVRRTALIVGQKSLRKSACAATADGIYSKVIRFVFDLIFGVAIALAVAYGLAAVLREYTAVTWWRWKRLA